METVIELQLGRADFQVDPSAVRAHARLAGIGEVAVLGEHVLAAADLCISTRSTACLSLKLARKG